MSIRPSQLHYLQVITRFTRHVGSVLRYLNDPTEALFGAFDRAAEAHVTPVIVALTDTNLGGS